MRRVAVAALSAVLLGGLPAAALTPSTAGPPGSPGSVAAAEAAAEAGPATHSVTLITGDRVAVQGSGETRALTPIAAPRPDGRTVSFHTVRSGDAHYVIPSDIAPLARDTLDLALFDVAGLVEAGYDDATLAASGRDSLPVIVQSAPATTKAAGAVDWKRLGLTREWTLQSIGAVAGTVDVATADGSRPAKAWGLLRAVGAGSATAGETRAKAGPGVTKVWLDGRVEALDADSTPQVGAPEAWAAGHTGAGVTVGVVDTGVDATHPDLDESVVAARDFTGGDNPADGFGHGTHVASILAGSGDADPDMTGVAPGADIISAKVLDDDGFGEWSWIIDGMEWAAQEGAQVLNLSLGEQGSYTDGTDPASLAVNALSEEYGVLVVAAAGNEGPRAGTVSPPAVADAALAVAAVDDDDQRAEFSSAGPRAGDAALKPDIAGPGVDIVAARAAGTELGEPVGDSYVIASGTSMAAPHVAGAAAVLLSARPDLTWQEVKSTLMASAQSGGNSVWEEGAGRVWIPGAIEQRVTASPASVSLGGFEFPQDDVDPVTRTVTYTNSGDADATLDLALDVSQGGEPAEGAVTLSAESVTVPAGGTGSVDVTAYPAEAGIGDIGGAITATGAGGTVRTTVGFANEPELFDLTISATDVDGSPAEDGGDFFVVQGLDDPEFFTFTEFDENGTSIARVPAGRYTVSGFLVVSDEAFAPLSTTSAAFPLVEVAEDTELVVDGPEAQPVTIDTARETGVASTAVDLSYETDGFGMSNGFFGELGDLYTMPVAEPAAGHYRQTWWAQLDEKLLDVRAGELSLDLVPYALDEPVTGRFTAPLVDAGLGEDFSGAEGSWAFVEHAGPETLQGVADAAAAAGVETLLVAGSEKGYVDDWLESAPLPVFGVPAGQAAALKAQLADGPVTLTVAGKAAASYSYALSFSRDGAVPDEPIAYVADRSTTGSIRVSVAAPTPGATPYVGGTVTSAGSGFGTFTKVPAPHTRTVFVSADEDVAFSPGASVTEDNPFLGMFDGPGRSLAPGERAADRLLAPVFHGGIVGGLGLRVDNAMAVYLPAYVDDAAHGIWGLPGEDAETRLRLWAGDELVADSVGSTEVSAEDLPAARTPYRMRLDTAYSGDWWRTSTDVSTEWRFRSATGGSEEEPLFLPLLQVDYGVPAAPDGSVGRTARLTLSADHQQGSAGAAVTGMRLWASSDDGESWREVDVRRGKGHTFRAVVRAARGAEFVSLKAQATDADGGHVTETVIRAYRID